MQCEFFWVYNESFCNVLHTTTFFSTRCFYDYNSYFFWKQGVGVYIQRKLLYSQSHGLNKFQRIIVNPKETKYYVAIPPIKW